MRHFLFRFAFAYWVLCFFPLPISALPGFEWLGSLVEDLWNAIIPWVGKNLLGIEHEIPLAPTGSGDRLADWIFFLCCLVLAAAIAAVWTVWRARGAGHPGLRAFLRIYLRYVLAYSMLGYGFAKIFKSQFPFPSSGRLMTEYGDSSPMGLLWTFMGYSLPYNLFTGGLEVAGALLLFFRKTALLGALIVCGVMSNIVMLNFCYDVPVKLYSTQLLIIAATIAAPDLRRLADFFFLNRPLPAAELGEPHPLAGIYRVEEMTTTSTAAWITVSIDHYRNRARLYVEHRDGSFERFRVEQPENQDLFELKADLDQSPRGRLAYAVDGPEHLTLTGTVAGAPLSVRLEKTDQSRLLLLSRGFRWISEAPFGR